MYEVTLLCYNDDHHKYYWFQGEYLGKTFEDVAESMFYQGMEQGECSNSKLVIKEISIFDFPEKICDTLDNYLTREKDIHLKIFKKLISEKFCDAKAILWLEDEEVT